ncbi:MAG: ABC transporter permease [Methanobacteriota archaeon]|nr:MAG: ABC transporter permease [Euryarchaeota archaeon]
MRLRTYLIRRAIHTVITLLVVLVLLFVIFRLMPGDPSRFFIAPGQPRQVQDEICVSFGLCKWVSAPGHGYESQISAGDPGPYNITAWVNDTAGNRGRYGFVYNNIPIADSQNRNHPYVVVTDVTLQAPGVNPRPSLAYAEPGPTATVVVRAHIKVVPGPATVSLRVLYGTSWSTPVLVNESGGYVHWDVGIPLAGTYWAVLHAQNVTGIGVDFALGFAVNNPVSGFDLVEDKIYGVRPVFPPDRAIISVNVTSRSAAIYNVTANSRSPAGFTQSDIRLRHPLEAVRRNLGEQFVIYFLNMLQGNFGNSFYTKRPVMDEIALRIGPTLLLFGSAVVISYLLGILLGAILAWRRGTKMELSAIVVSLFFYSMPVFWFGLVLLWFFAFTLKNPDGGALFPLQGIGGFDPGSGVAFSGFGLVKDILWHMTLPLSNLVILGLAGHVLLMRNSMLEVMGEDYILTAKAKGLSERRVMYRHAARNALLPVVTALAISIGGVISGGVLTETIFSWPGMGYFLVSATLQQDYPSVQAAFFILAVITILANTVADVLYAWLDPRVRL